MVWDTKIVPEAGNTDSTVDPSEIFVEWADHFHKLLVARDRVQKYLDSQHGSPDVSLGYSVATRLLLDIDSNVQLAITAWPAWLGPKENTAEFIVQVNHMVADYRMLNAKFNEWANQFGVK